MSTAMTARPRLTRAADSNLRGFLTAQPVSDIRKIRPRSEKPRAFCVSGGRVCGALILRSDPKDRVSKDEGGYSEFAAILRDAMLRMAPQDEGGVGCCLPTTN